METESTTLNKLRLRLSRLEADLAEAQQRMPAHSVKPTQMAALLDLEDERDRLQDSIRAITAGAPPPLTRRTPGGQCIARHIVFFETHYSLCADRLMDDQGGAPARAVADLIRRYIDAPPAAAPVHDDWCSLRELRGAGPLVVNFANNTHKTIAATFAGDLNGLDRAAAGAGGVMESEPGYDRRYRFQALPQVPLILNYNAPDDLFPAQANLLFRRAVQTFIDIRDLLTLATFLTGRLMATRLSVGLHVRCAGEMPDLPPGA